MTFTFGYWLIPAFVTIAIFALAHGMSGPSNGPSNLVEALYGPLFSILFYGAAAIISLISWLVYFMVF
jgi:hypothetical protein